MRIVIEKNYGIAGGYKYTYSDKRNKKQTVFTDLQSIFNEIKIDTIAQQQLLKTKDTTQ